METPRLNCHKGILVLLLLLQTAGGAMAQNGSQNRSQNRSQNGPQNKSQSGPQNKAHNKPLIETPVLDKWTGSVELISGLGISHLSNDADDSDPYTHLLEQVKLILSRATSTFSFNTEAQGFFEKNETFTQRTTMRGQSRTEILSRKSEFIRPGSSLRSDFSWFPTKEQQISAYLSYDYGFDKSDNQSASLLTDTMDLFNFKMSLEDCRIHQHIAEAGWETRHHLGSSRRQLLTSGDWKGSFNDQVSLWTRLMMGLSNGVASEDSRAIKYRLTSYTNEQDGTLSVSYRDSLIKSRHHLTIEPGVRARLSGTWNDNNGDINMGDDTWRDSTGLHEDFVFTTVQLEPRLQLEYRYSSLLLSADYSLQFYGQDLSSQLRDQQMEWQRAAVIGGSSIEWAPGAGHLLTLGSTLSVIHPDYQELSWYLRQDTDQNQLTQGNPDLASTRTISTDLTWRYNKGGFDFSTATAFDYTTGEIDQTFNNRKIDGVDYRVFTWINTDFTRSLTQRLQLNWRSRFVAANMRAHYQYSWLKEPDTDDLSQFNNWEVRAEITVRPRGGWMFSTNGFYRSNTRSLYRNTKDIYTIGARIAKEFKRFTVYLEGQDLLDHPVTTESSSQDRSQLMVQKMNMNRRLFLLGLTIKINE